MSQKKGQDIFTRFTSNVASILGHAWVFASALLILIVWAVTGPLLGFSDTWQLIINTGTTIITFLMVFIIQNTQNRDNLAMNLKMDALMQKAGITASDLMEAEDKSDKKLEHERKRMQRKANNKTGNKKTRKK
jgi:low affinity Fe/Cu permease